MSKVWDKPITADTDWGGDASTDNLPVSGRQVQAWIKGNIKNDDAISLLIAKWLNEHTTNSITFWKGLPIDSGTLKWVDKHLTVIGGTGSSETPQDLPFIYDPVKKAWEFKGDFVVTGAITMFGSLSGFQPSTVTEAVEVDGETIVKTKNTQGQWQLTAIGGGGGTGGGISAAEVNILISNALKPYALATSIPTDNKQLSNGAGYATVSDLDTRINNLINGAPAAYDTLKEIADVLAGNVNSIGDILTALDTKATKTYVDTELTKYVKLATAQTISAQHNFDNGLQIGGLPIAKSASANDTIYLDANLVVSGAITMFGSGSTTFPTIWANIPFNLEHMSWDGSQWNIIGGGGSGSLDTNAVNVLISEYLTKNSYATISDISSALVGYASLGWVGDNYLATSGGTITTDSIAGFSIYRNNAEYSAVHFYNTQDGNKIDVGYLGAASDGRPVYINAGGGVNPLLHSGNYSDYALPITGGTVNGNVTLNRLYTTEGVVLTNTGDSYSGLIPNSRITSGGDDKDFWLYNQEGAINHYATSYAFNRGNALFQGLITAPTFIGNLTGNADSANKQVIEYSSKDIDTWDISNGTARIFGMVESSNIPPDTTSIGSILSEYAWDSNAGAQIYINPVNDKILYRSRWGGAFYNWRTIAHIGSNVASATKLETPRTIWGHSFDGTANIESGAKPRFTYALFCTEYDNEVGYIGRVSGLNTDVYLTALAGSALRFGSNGIDDRFFLDLNGNVAIGSTTADAKLHVHGDIKATSLIADYVMSSNSTTDGYYVGLASSGAPPYKGLLLYTYGGTPISMYTGNTMRMAIGAEGDVTIYGNLLTTGVITMFSQASMKNEVDRFGLSLEQLSMIEPVRFTWKDDRDTLVHAGGIADEVMRVLPEVVHRTKDDKLTMDYGSAGFFIATSLIKPVIDHEQRLQSAEKEIKDLRAENKRLREQLSA